MNAELAAIKDAVDKSTGDGRDLAKAQQLAKSYVEAHPEEFTDYQAWGNDDAAREKTVQAVDVFRAAGMDEAQWRAEAWHLFSWEPPNIGGTFQPAIRNILPAAQ